MSVTITPSVEEMNARINIGLQRGVLAWAMLAAQTAKLLAPVKTTRLAREIKWGEPYMKTNQIAACQYGVSGLEYAMAQEFGSGLYIEQDPDTPGGHAPAKYPIIAGYWTGKSDKRYLGFAWPNGPKNHPAYDEKSGKFFFKQVMHPGVHPHPYLRPAYTNTKAEGARLVMAAVMAELKR